MSIKSLKDEDMISVIGFDGAPFVIIDMQPVKKAKVRAERRLRNLTAAGGTNLLPAMAAARKKMESVKAGRKHIIILSDGKLPLSSDAYVGEINRLRRAGVSISTVALGYEADVPFMQLVAKWGKGAFYHALDPRRLPQIFVSDIKVSTGETTMKEKEKFQVRPGPSGISSTRVRSFRHLRGFVETSPKKGAKLELVTRKKQNYYPIMASWFYGKGKVIAFTSDANGRWSLPWLRWKGFPRFWGDMIKQVRSRGESSQREIDFDFRSHLNGNNLEFDLAIFDPSKKPLNTFEATVTHSNGVTKTLTFEKTAKGRFKTQYANATAGDYRLDVQYGSTKLPELAVSIPKDAFGEQEGKGIDFKELQTIAALSGGSMNPSPSALLRTQTVTEEKTQLFPPLAILAFVLILLEALVRERRGW